MKENEITQTNYYSLSTTRIQPSLNDNMSNNFTTAHDLLIDRFSIEISQDKKKKRIELTLGDKVCFVIKPSSDLVCDTIVRGHLSKKFGSLESPTVYVLVTDNKLDFYKIVEIAHKKYKMNLDIVLNQTIVKRVFTIHQLTHYLIRDLEKDIKKCESKLVIITGDFFLSYSQVSKEEKDQFIVASRRI